MGNRRIKEYTAVSVPKDLIKEIDRLIGLLGYTSRSEFVKDAIRERIIAVKSLWKDLEDRE
ncbi:MAG: ribbon-helix-helix domain-containing protein [Nitrososphaerota archaeon]